MRILNYTPHLIRIVSADGAVIAEIPPEPVSIRLESETVRLGEIKGVPLSVTRYGEPTGLPAPASDTLLVVSQLVFGACPSRRDLCVPAEAVRDAAGRIVGCQSLGMRPD